MHKIFLGGFLGCLGFIFIGLITFLWFRDIINESTFSGDHTNAVQIGLREGFFLFIASEIMLFFGFF
jgi:heme/copper-type cytochrome/quinol oxidase subunit 3